MIKEDGGKRDRGRGGDGVRERYVRGSGLEDESRGICYVSQMRRE